MKALKSLIGEIHREGAISAYQHYLVLRAEPEPALADDVNQVRAELAQLIEETSS